MGLTSKAKAKSVRGEIAFSTHTGQTLEVVREHAEGEEFFRGDQSKHGDPAEEDVVRLTTVLKECVIGRVTRSAVALTVRGRGAQGFVVPGAGYRGKHVRCTFSDILDAVNGVSKQAE